MMLATSFLILLIVSVAVAAPHTLYEDYSDLIPQKRTNLLSLEVSPDDPINNELVPQKRAALVLDRLLVALQKALREHEATSESEGPQTSPLRDTRLEYNDVSQLQRRGQAGGGRGRVLRCYFNAITCF